MKCRKCATELEPWHKFCCSCGREVEEGDGAGEQTAKRSTKSVPMETESGRSQEQSQEEKTSAGKLSDSFPRTKIINSYSYEVILPLSTKKVCKCRKLLHCCSRGFLLLFLQYLNLNASIGVHSALILTFIATTKIRYYKTK